MLLTGDMQTDTLSPRNLVVHMDDAKTRARQALESVSFDVHESRQFVDYAKSFTARASKTKGGFRWLCLVLVGLVAGGVAVLIQFLLMQVNEFNLHTQRWLFDMEVGLWFRYLVWVGTSIVLVSVAAALVCFVEPLAGGSGIPEIKCVLNGIDLPNVLKLRTLGAKVLGIVCSVGAGLPCGKEGPMIHSGAIVAAQAAKMNAGPIIAPFRQSAESRDFIAAGAAAGVAAAFGAPIGGVLFAVEEGASHMNPRIMVRTFVCAAVASLTVRFFAGPMEGMLAWGTLGTEVPVEFGRFYSQKYQIWELPIFAAMGIFGGLCGALFNELNMRLSKWRMRHVGARGCVRFFEALFVTVAIVSFNFFAPLLKQDGSTHMGGFCAAQKLFTDRGGEAIRELFHSEEHIDMGMLSFFALIHFAQTVWTYGLGVPSGLFVPSLLGGASFGRIVGQFMYQFHPLATTPGFYALMGAAAMLSGMARITISLVVILMETTGEANWSIPLFVVVMCATWTGNYFNKGIYHIHIELRHIPLLEQRPEDELLALQAKDIMSEKVTSFHCRATVKDLIGTLEGCRHGAFPVVDASDRFVGLLERSTIMHVLQLGKQYGALTRCPAVDKDNMVPYVEMVRNGHPKKPALSAVKEALAAEDYDKIVDLTPYTDMGCYTVQECASAMRCHTLFRSMGLRHLTVLSDGHVVRGIITRKELVAAAERAEEQGCGGLPAVDNKVAGRGCLQQEQSSSEDESEEEEEDVEMGETSPIVCNDVFVESAKGSISV